MCVGLCVCVNRRFLSCMVFKSVVYLKDLRHKACKRHSLDEKGYVYIFSFTNSIFILYTYVYNLPYMCVYIYPPSG